MHLRDLRLHVTLLALEILPQLRLLVQLEKDLLESIRLPSVLLLEVKVSYFKLIEPSHQLSRLTGRQIQLLLRFLVVVLGHRGVRCRVVNRLLHQASELRVVLPCRVR